VLREPANHGQKSARTNTKNEINDDGRDGTKKKKKKKAASVTGSFHQKRANIGKPPPPL
jgi:ribosome assembly protein YihI (activator of Der GTPase)